jgi:hypothetical protein
MSNLTDSKKQPGFGSLNGDRGGELIYSCLEKIVEDSQDISIGMMGGGNNG